MKPLTVLCCLLLVSICSAAEPSIMLAQAQIEPTKPVDMSQAQPRMMGLYEQGWYEGHKQGNANSGKLGWFFIGFGNVPLMWLPWVVEPSHPGKPPILAEEEFNSGYKQGYRNGWKNAHKNYYIAGTLVSSAIAAGVIIATQ